MAGKNESLRARKKRATRDAIAAAARRLFAERGFDAVTVAEVAAAADVSEKTVFNHFAAKEDLVFALGEERLQRLVDAIAQRPAGTSVLDVFRATTQAMIDGLATPTGQDDLFVLPRIIRGSRVLQERLSAGWEREYAVLTAAIAASTGAEEDDVVPAIVARSLSWTHRTILRQALASVLGGGEDPVQVAERLRVAATRAYDQLAEGLGGYGTAAAPASARSIGVNDAE